MLVYIIFSQNSKWNALRTWRLGRPLSNLNAAVHHRTIPQIADLRGASCSTIKFLCGVLMNVIIKSILNWFVTVSRPTALYCVGPGFLITQIPALFSILGFTLLYWWQWKFGMFRGFSVGNKYKGIGNGIRKIALVKVIKSLEDTIPKSLCSKMFPGIS